MSRGVAMTFLGGVSGNVQVVTQRRKHPFTEASQSAIARP